jgi:hypothetical protein
VPPTPRFAEDGITYVPQLVHCDELARIYLILCLRDQGLVGKGKMFKIRSEHRDGREIES